MQEDFFTKIASLLKKYWYLILILLIFSLFSETVRHFILGSIMFIALGFLFLVIGAFIYFDIIKKGTKAIFEIQIKKWLNLFVLLASTPLLFLNSFGGIIAFIWLMFAGEWTLIGYGVLGLLFSAFALSVPFLLSGAIAIAGIKIYQKIKILGYPFFLLAVLVNILTIIFWVGYVYQFAINNSNNSTSIFAVMLWAYCVSVGPIQYMASKEGRENTASLILTFFTSLGCAWITLSHGLFGINIAASYVGFFVLMFVCTLIQFIISLTFKANLTQDNY
jgi:hypothetical protein